MYYIRSIDGPQLIWFYSDRWMSKYAEMHGKILQNGQYTVFILEIVNIHTLYLVNIGKEKTNESDHHGNVYFT